MNYRESMEYMESLGGYGIVPGLDNIRELCRRIGDPQETLRFVHIAGTNGKGSVLAYLSTILKCAGYRVGRYLSPVIAEYREKIQVNGRHITQKAVCEGVALLRDACDAMVADGWAHPTPFEVETALGFWYFREQKCDIVVLETGMGGAEDATNLICGTEVAILTPISMDHMQYLGRTLTEIAEQKAGIVKPGCTVVSAQQEAEAAKVIEKKAEELSCELLMADPGRISRVRYGLEKQRFDYGAYKNLALGLAGRFQIDNALLALTAVEALGKRGYVIPEKALREGLAGTLWYGRFSLLAKKPVFIADGAHNEDAAQKLADSIQFYFTNKRIIYIMGILKDKDYEKIIALTHPFAEQIITVTPPDNPRAMHALELAQEVAKVHPSVTAAGSLEEAVEMAYLLADGEDVIVAFGSLSYLGRLKKIVEKRLEKRHEGIR